MAIVNRRIAYTMTDEILSKQFPIKSTGNLSSDHLLFKGTHLPPVLMGLA